MAVSVDMLDTGYDHKEIENLVMLRPTTSAIKYAQMRGRGSRLCPRIGKTSFLIYDFVNNTANFDDPGEQYHRPKTVGKRPGSESRLQAEDHDAIVEPNRLKPGLQTAASAPPSSPKPKPATKPWTLPSYAGAC